MFDKFLIKKRLRKIREEKHLTRPQVFEATGIPTMTLTDWEIEKENMPRLDKAGLLAEFYDVSLDYIIGRTDDPTNPKINK